MNITHLEAYRLTLPLRSAVTTAHGTETSIPSILVRIENGAGTVGIGTADPIPSSHHYSDAETILADVYERAFPALLDHSPANPNQLDGCLDGVDGSPESRLAVETAFLDLFGKETGQSIADIVGGHRRRIIPTNGWIGVGSPERMADRARTLEQESFVGFKMKLSGELEQDIERVHAVSNAVSDAIAVRVDANTAYSVEDALKMAEVLEGLDVAHFEQPVGSDDITGMKRLSAATAVPILADESVRSPEGLVSVLAEHAADRIKVKIISLGGVLATHRAIGMCRFFNQRCVIGHGYCALPAAAAEMQLASAHDTIIYPSETVGHLKVANHPFQTDHSVSSAAIELENVPGLGVELRDGVLDGFVEEAASMAE